MTPNEIVPLFLTILMAVLCVVALVGGHNLDKKAKAEKKEE
jgi:sorbitol-specific phosphotransferase system component IIC